MQLIRQNFQADKRAAYGRTQAVVEGDFDVPGSDAEIKGFLGATGTLYIGKYECLADKMSLEGTANFQVMYLTREGQPRAFTVPCMFSHSMDLPGAAPRMRAQTQGVLRDVQLSETAQQKVHISAVADISCTLFSGATVNAAGDIKEIPDVQIQFGDINGLSILEVAAEAFTVQDEYLLSTRLPPVSHILFYDLKVNAENIAAQSAQVYLTGEIEAAIFYVGADQDAPLQSVKHTFPFETAVPVDASSYGAMADAQITVRDAQVSCAEDENGEKRLLRIDATAAAVIQIMEKTQAQVIVDAYSPEQILQLATEEIVLPQLPQKYQNVQAFEEAAYIQANAPRIGRPLYASAVPVISRVEPGNGSVTIEGVMEYMFLYADTDNVLRCAQIDQPLLFESPFDDVRAQDLVSVTLSPGTLSVVAYDENEIQLKFNQTIDALVYPIETYEVVTDIAEGGLPEKRENSSLVLYFVQPDDTTWSIARRFNVAAEAILAYNPEMKADGPKPGDRILFFRPATTGSR